MRQHDSLLFRKVDRKKEAGKTRKYMMVHPTTLILGAGASWEMGYPTGCELREMILKKRHLSHFFPDTIQAHLEGLLAERFRNSMIPSIDAFLAEEENAELRECGKWLIAALLLPCESQFYPDNRNKASGVGSNHRKNPPNWIREVFNAIRGPKNQSRHRLNIVTFNYDLSVEFLLTKAFEGAYRMTRDAAWQRVKEAVDITHVYGYLGKIEEMLEPEDDASVGRQYGGVVDAMKIINAAKTIQVIERNPESANFLKAQTAIKHSQYIAVLGFGFDRANVENLKLREMSEGRSVWTTGFQMGFGTRGLIRSEYLPGALIGSPKQDCSQFIEATGLLQWANLPGKSSYQMRQACLDYLNDKRIRLPY